MAVTKKRLFGPAALTNTAATKYTVPASTKTIIRKIHVSNPSANSVNLTLSIGADAAGTRLYDAYPIPAGTVLDIWGPITMDATEILQAFGSTTSVLVVTIDGEENTLG